MLPLLPSFIGDPVTIVEVCGCCVVVGTVSGSVTVINFAPSDWSKCPEVLSQLTLAHAGESKATAAAGASLEASAKALTARNAVKGKHDDNEDADEPADLQAIGIAVGSDLSSPGSMTAPPAAGAAADPTPAAHVSPNRKAWTLGEVFDKAPGTLLRQLVTVSQPFAVSRLQLGSDLPLTGAHLRGRKLYVAVADVGADVWDLSTFVKEQEADRSRTSGTSALTYNFQLGTQLFVFQVGLKLHPVIDMITGSKSMQPVPLARGNFPISFNGDYLVIRSLTFDGPATAKVRNWETVQDDCTFEWTEADGNIAWGFNVVGSHLFMVQDDTCTVRDVSTGTVVTRLRAGSHIAAFHATPEGIIAVTANQWVLVWEPVSFKRLFATRLAARAEFVTGVPYIARFVPPNHAVFNDDVATHLCSLL